MTDALREFLAAFADAQQIEPETDLNNPWPPGCRWHDLHNELWRKNRRRRRT